MLSAELVHEAIASGMLRLKREGHLVVGVRLGPADCLTLVSDFVPSGIPPFQIASIVVSGESLYVEGGGEDGKVEFHTQLDF